jgi:putative ABC transport system substrate-binding protein
MMVRRREFITVLGCAAALPLPAGAQQPAMPVIGFLNAQSPDGFTEQLRGFRLGLKETGYVEGENVTIEYRWAENQIDRLPALAAELIRRRVAVIAATGGPPAALAAKATTTTIPIVFLAADDPVRLGLVASLGRPGGNLTGINMVSAELGAKRLELLRELVPAATRMAVLNDPTGSSAEIALRNVEAAARAMGLQIEVYNVNSSREIAAAFASFMRERTDAVFVSAGPFVTSRRVQLALLAARYAVPAAYAVREHAEVGGLLSYGTSVSDSYRQVGAYTGRILKGAKPTDLPVVQATKLDLVINADTARLLGLTVPPMLLARADEVIE